MPMAGGAPDTLTSREQVLGVFFGWWMIVGLFLDGWAHDNNRPESFFTPWHAILYSGFAGAAAGAVWVVIARRHPGRSLRDTLPEGHGLTLAGLCVFAAAALGDLVWHETLGIEVGIEALLSPTHLALLGSGIVALSAPLRTAWAHSPREPETLREILAPLMSLALLTALSASSCSTCRPSSTTLPPTGSRDSRRLPMSILRTIPPSSVRSSVSRRSS